MKTAKALFAWAALVAFVAVGAAYGVTAGEKVKTSGLITGRSGEDLTVKTSDEGELTVVLTDETKIEQPKGLLKVRKEKMGVTALVPGLSIQLEGTGDPHGRVTAEKIKFSKESLKVANQIQAGMAPTNEDVQANKQSIEANKDAISQNKQDIAENQTEIEKANKRFSQLDDYETKETVTLFYPVGSSKLDDKQKAQLSDLAQKTSGMQGYLVQVAGYTDSSGNAAYNQELSQDRAENVVNYLQQTGKIPLLNIVAPGAMGETNPASNNESAQGRSENRRVVVKVLVNKGMAATAH